MDVQLVSVHGGVLLLLEVRECRFVIASEVFKNVSY